MKWIYYIVVFLIISLILSSVIFFNQAIAKENSISVVNYHKHSIKITVPNIKEEMLRNVVDEKIDEVKKRFLKEITGIEEQSDFLYTLYIDGTFYDYKNYKSVFIEISKYTGGAHPNYILWTYVYDVKRKCTVTLDDLINENPNFLIEVSRSIQSDFLLKDYSFNTTWMMEGTSPKRENYQNFVFTEKGILFFFPPYQIAPYSEGIIKMYVDYKV